MVIPVTFFCKFCYSWSISETYWQGSSSVWLRVSGFCFLTHTKSAGWCSQELEGPGAVAQWLRSSPFTPGIPYGASSNPSSPTSLPAPCLWPGKSVEDGPKLWDPALAWETWRRLLALDRHRISRCTHIGSESSDGRCSSLSLLPVYPHFQ